jgi:hypothetical protein
MEISQPRMRFQLRQQITRTRDVLVSTHRSLVSARRAAAKHLEGDRVEMAIVDAVTGERFGLER